MPKSRAPINPKQRKFIAEYLKDQNGTQAAIRAGYSKHTANQQATDILAKPCISKEIEKRMRRVEAKCEITAEMVLKELKALSFHNLKDAYNPDGSMKSIHTMPEELQRSLTSIETDQLGSGKKKIGWTRKIRTMGKDRPLELLGKHLKMFPTHVQLTGEDNGPVTFKYEDAE